MKTFATDCLVIGAGLAGSAYALQLARRGFQVELLSLGDPLASNSDRAQGGIIFDETPEASQFAADILAASGGTANPAAVAQLVQDGPVALKELLLGDLEVAFDRDATGALDFTREAGHRARRIIHAKDATGHAILERLVARVGATPGIRRRRGWIAAELLCTTPHSPHVVAECGGAYVLDSATGEIHAIVARKTVLATGGYSGLFRHHTNQPGTVGHGLAMADLAGARLADLEYLQFHPTVFFGADAPRFLITEALRGEGAVLVDSQGHRFMDDCDPRGSLAPRDVVSRAIQAELARSGEACVWLDATGLRPGFLQERFPGVDRRCREFGVDPTRDRIPVVPAAHYACGGVHTDLRGRTTVTNLNAIGEAACTGLHGANRLASTSLLEALVGARATAAADVADLGREPRRSLVPAPWPAGKLEPDLDHVRREIRLIQDTMWRGCGMVRSAASLVRAARVLQQLRADLGETYRQCRLVPELIELRHALQAALLVVGAAARNPVSRGCHFRSDASRPVRDSLQPSAPV